MTDISLNLMSESHNLSQIKRLLSIAAVLANPVYADALAALEAEAEKAMTAEPL